MEFEYAKSVYNFDEMIVVGPNGWWKLKFMDGELYRIGGNRFCNLSPIVNEAYLEYKVEQILLGDNEE